ncbi:alpha/beta-hydrolase [Aspergillus falconensis]
MVSLPPGGRTLIYSVVNDHPIKLDYYLPTSHGALPAMIYYHGGGMTAGSRRSAGLPHWMYDHCQKKGYIFISADYRLCHPSTALDQVDDAKALFAFLAGESFSKELPDGVSLDTSKIAVTGFSAGAYSARAACLYATPKPAAMMSVYGTGGDWLLDHWTRGRPATSIAKFVALESVPELLADKTVISEDNVRVIGAEGKSKSRFALTVRWELDGTFLDGCLGRPGLGRMLDGVKHEERANVIPEDLRPAFLQLFVDEAYPPSVFVHGTADEVVSPEESAHHHETLKKLGVKSELFLVQDGGHGLMEFGDGPPRPAKGAMEAYIRALEFIDEVFGR